MNSLSGENIEEPLPIVEAARDEDRGNESEDEVEYSEDEQDRDREDRESESDHEAEESRDGEPTADLAVSWLGSPSKNQKILRKGKLYKILLPYVPIAKFPYFSCPI